VVEGGGSRGGCVGMETSAAMRREKSGAANLEWRGRGAEGSMEFRPQKPGLKAGGWNE
jgi:hypothetical protein